MIINVTALTIMITALTPDAGNTPPYCTRQLVRCARYLSCPCKKDTGKEQAKGVPPLESPPVAFVFSILTVRIWIWHAPISLGRLPGAAFVGCSGPRLNRGPQVQPSEKKGKRLSEGGAGPIPYTDQYRKKNVSGTPGIQGVKPLVILFPASFSYARERGARSQRQDGADLYGSLD